MDTEYDVTITYDSPDTYDASKTSSKTYRAYLSTPEYEYPEHGLSVTGKTGESITVSKDMSLPTANQIVDVVVHIGKDTYNMGDASTFVCGNLYKDVEYEVYFEYVVVAPNGNRYPLESEHITVKTLAFTAPTIVSFAESRKSSSSLTIAYEYLDEDRVVENAYILLNGENVKEISTKSGSTTLSKLDFDNEAYEVQLVIEYLDEDGETVQVKSDVLKYEIVQPEPTPDPEKPKGGCGKKGVELFVSLMAASAVIGILLRKRK